MFSRAVLISIFSLFFLCVLGFFALNRGAGIVRNQSVISASIIMPYLQEGWSISCLNKTDKSAVNKWREKTPKDRHIRNMILQGALKKAGFNPGPIDGKIGPKTSVAVKNFQRAHNLIPDGKIGKRTLAKLKKYIECN